LLAGVSLICLMMFSNRLRLVSFENATMTVAASPSVENAAAPGRFEASPLSRMGAQVVPAALAIKAEDNISGPVVAKTAVQNSFKATRKPGVIPASAGQRRAKAPTVVRTSQASDAAVPQILFLVMQTDIVQDRQYGASGAVVWDLCVWQVIVVGPVQKQNTMEAGIIAKSI
jgi:hypothetical protein